MASTVPSSAFGQLLLIDTIVLLSICRYFFFIGFSILFFTFQYFTLIIRSVLLSIFNYFILIGFVVLLPTYFAVGTYSIFVRFACVKKLSRCFLRFPTLLTCFHKEKYLPRIYPIR